jgi:ornithine cyclodeaminase
MRIVTDKDLESFPIGFAIEAVQDFFHSAKSGNVVSPPRYTVVAGEGALTFTIGAELKKTKTTGFRVYDTYPGREGTDSDQIVAVYSTEKSELKGLVVGSKLGAIRTAAINGFAMSLLAKKEVDTASLIGAGHHACYQLEALLTVRHPRNVLIVNRTLHKAESLAAKFKHHKGIEFVAVSDAEAAVRVSDIVMCATSSSSPVLKVEWLKPGAYISSIGPKFVNRHELPTDIQSGASVVVSDAIEQIAAYQTGYFLEDISSIQPLESITECSSGKAHSVFLSTGRSGTEVVVADCVLKHVHNN